MLRASRFFSLQIMIFPSACLSSPRLAPSPIHWFGWMGEPLPTTPPPPRFRSSGFWFLSRNIIPDNFIYYFLRALRPVSLLWRELPWLLQQQHCCCNSYTWMMKWRIFFVRLHCPSLPLSLFESLPLPLYPLPLIPFIQIACYFQCTPLARSLLFFGSCLMY